MSEFSHILHFYNSEGSYLVLYFICLCWVIWVGRDRENRRFFWYTVLTYLLIANPISKIGLEWVFASYTEKVRLIYVFPTTFLMAFVLVDVVSRVKSIYERIGIIILASLMVAFAGNDYYTTETYLPKENAYKIPNMSIEMVDLMRQEIPEGDIKIAAPLDEIYPEMRQYDPGIINVGNAVRRRHLDEAEDPSFYSEEYGYIVIQDEEDILEIYESHGYESIYQGGGYQLLVSSE